MPVSYKVVNGKRRYTDVTRIVKKKSPLTRKVNSLARKVDKLPKPELKHKDNFVLNPVNIGYNLNTANYALFDPAQGDSVQHRDGDSATMRKLFIRGRFTANAAQAEPFICRFILIQAKQRYSPSITATSGVTQLLENPGTNDSVQSMYSFVNRVHYRVLRDFRVTVQSTGTAGGATVDQKFFTVSYTFKKFNRRVQFDAGGTITQMNQVYLLALSTAGANYPTMEFDSRITFYDN